MLQSALLKSLHYYCGGYNNTAPPGRSTRCHPICPTGPDAIHRAGDALIAAFFNPPDRDLLSGNFEFVELVVEGDTLLSRIGHLRKTLGNR